MCATRAYIMRIIGGVLMLDKNNNKGYLMYFPLLTNLHNARSYSWGSTILAISYRELFRMAKPYVMDIDGYLILLYSWALYWISFLASVSHQGYVFPLVNRWYGNPGIERSYMVPIYCQMIDTHAREMFIWMPYSFSDIVTVVNVSAHIYSHLWCINTLIINFQIVEWYHED
ncbi:hypothetical protein PVK06_005753 [Gossypium arboreum]|uniref:Aminotransferase-like plant mobile domain-containing protein n=1 Tax=Gossypium arboreum TaxID=29729 RepID=A0ABR0QVD4_GOSAR|nr:hypothetical protein PVK06_005753 [Gossypium arboreum]